MSTINRNRICYFHFSNPEPGCMDCNIRESARPNAQEEYGTTDLASSIYPEIDSSILAGPDFSYILPRKGGFTAPVAQMFNPSSSPFLKLDTNLRFVSNFCPPPYKISVPFDRYGDQHALTPVDEEGHYAEALALSPVRKARCKLHRRQKQSKAKAHRTYDYAEELALSPVCKKHGKLPRRVQKQAEVTKDIGRASMARFAPSWAGTELALPARKQLEVAEIFDSITVDIPEEEQEEAVGSQEATQQVEDKYVEDSPMEKSARGRKRKHSRDEDDKPARKSVRSRKAISYTE
ncbi:hypothetical protein L207DRAFT_132469 [Hyaloscypha variabilis F]|uniref:Uncharacterized protein n=1 Tax=Hyaloscypha variabilis (strain UAMH 11265 / GT02V1 / F) TaxID=1149755 RepID=A0A2J6R686_HYAVF|nr:hypothetical protein L207DRAFT_132469 [Hyaloscypha variabilis F]